MTNLELTEKEAALLIDVLESSLSDLKTERLRTDNRKLHAGFVERENSIADLIKRLDVKK
jgi:hypothetical protein